MRVLNGSLPADSGQPQNSPARRRRSQVLVTRHSPLTTTNWLPDMDLNHDKQIQSLLCYRYTIGQTSSLKVGFSPDESRMDG
jgi:hypothetical protein